MSISMRARLGLGAAALSLALLAAPAQAQRATGTFFPAQPIDGPSADIRSVGDVDVARDGAGIITWVKRDGGEDHVFAALIEGGTPLGGFRVDPGLPEVLGKPVAATGNGGRMAIAFANSQGVWATVRPAAGQAFGPLQQLGLPGTLAPSVDIAVNGEGYLAWSQGGDIGSAFLARTAPGFTGHPTPLDLDPARDAGTGAALSPRVTASADGIGLVAWGERDAAGLTHLVVRRLVRDRISVVGAEANAASIDGLTAGSADMPDVTFEDDSSYAWVVFRQQAIDAAGVSTTRAIARRLRGSAFDAPATIDGGAALPDSSVPRVGINGRGQGILTVETPGTVLASIVKDDAITPPRVLGSAAAAGARPVAGFAENFDGVTAWLQASAAGTEVRGRLLEDDIALAQPPPFGPDVVLSDPALGPVDASAGIDADVTRAGDAAVVFVQEAPDGSRRLVLAAYDRAPGDPVGTTSTGWRRTTQPQLAWAGAFDVWGGITYSVLLDGQPIGTTGDVRFTTPGPITDGIHRWQVIATDRRGQVARGATRNLRIDGTAPKMLIKIGGKRQVGKRITFFVRAIDLRSPAGSGIKQVRIDYRDGTPAIVTKAERPTFSKVFSRRGTYSVRITATDAAGNYVLAYRKVVVKKPPKKSKKKQSKKKTTTKPRKAPATEPQDTTTPEETPTEPAPPGEPTDPGGVGARR